VKRLFAMLFLGVAACADPPPPAPFVQPVLIEPVGPAAGAMTLEFSGTVAAASSAEMGFEVPGQVVSIPVKEGQVVEADTILAKLDATEYEARLQAASASVAQAAREYDRAEASYAADAIPRAQYEIARRNRDVARADLIIAQKGVSDATLRAPFRGRISRVIVEEFDTVGARQPVVLLEDDSTFEVIVVVPEGDFASAAPGLSKEERSERLAATITLAAFPDQPQPASLKEYSTSADPVTRTFTATFAFDDPDQLTVFPGMTARVVVNPRSTDQGGHLVPVSGVIDDGSGDAVAFVVDASDVAHRKVVQLGGLYGDQVLVLEGLAEGERLVVSGTHFLRDGMTVNPLPTGEATP